MMLNKRALLKLGWTPHLIASLLGQPDRVERHTHGYKHWVEHLYQESRVHKAMGDSRFIEARSQRGARRARAEQRRAEIPLRYANWREALPDAAANMFSLNRYAKHRICSELHKVEVYRLKGEFLRALYEHGYCTLAWLHRLNLPERICRECGGDGMECGHCGGSGIWRESRSIDFWGFRFVVADKVYCWHQPAEAVEFLPSAGIPPQNWSRSSEEKPIPLPKRKLAAAKVLLRWVIDSMNGDSDERSAAEEEALPFEYPNVPGSSVSVREPCSV